jgi:trehalose 6-phosphate synthase
MIWNKENFCHLLQKKFSGQLIIAVSNREPYIHHHGGDEIKCQAAVGGVTSALDPAMRAINGIWIAHGGGDADRKTVSSQNKIMVPPDNPLYTLKRVWLKEKDLRGYYHGFSNQALWPLCHSAYVPPVFDRSHWDRYKKVNSIFARNVLGETQNRKAVVFIQDYHFSLLPRMIKKTNPAATLAQFWHIPWPYSQKFRICPWHEEILDGLLGNDLLGFHTATYCQNFLDTASSLKGAMVNYKDGEVIWKGQVTRIRPFPISVDFEQLSQDVQKGEVEEEFKRLKDRLGIQEETIIISIDRVDYTKGIPQRILALDRFLCAYPEYKEKLVLIQTGTPSRTNIPDYENLGQEIIRLTEWINQKHGSETWKPVINLPGPLLPLTLATLEGKADICIISSLDDGMNLVAKEYVASQINNGGILLLSSFTGAARELKHSIKINPFAPDLFARAIKDALEMPVAEKTRRMKKDRAIIRKNNIYKWAADIFLELSRLH